MFKITTSKKVFVIVSLAIFLFAFIRYLGFSVVRNIGDVLISIAILGVSIFFLFNIKIYLIIRNYIIYLLFFSFRFNIIPKVIIEEDNLDSVYINFLNFFFGFFVVVGSVWLFFAGEVL